MSETQPQDESGRTEQDEVGPERTADEDPEAGVERGSLVRERPVQEDLDEGGKLRGGGV